MFSASTSGLGGVTIENVFSTSLYTGNGSTQTITNGIDLGGQGGLVWVKNRNNGNSHALWDTARGAGTGGGTAANRALSSNLTDAQGLASLPGANSDYLSAFTSSGFTVVDPGIANEIANALGNTYVSWTFRKHPKFFDVVTYTGNGTARAINHSLGSVPGCVIVKCTSTAGDWYVTHRSFSTPAAYLLLNSSAAITSGSYFNVNAGGSLPMVNLTETTFGVNTSLNVSGQTYVAYLFAHDAGGFGPYGAGNAISCGSFTADGSGSATVSHGFANGAQFCIVKASSTTGNWEMFDDKRTPSWTSADARLYADLPNAEDTVNRLSGSGTSLTFDGLSAGQTYIYILVAAPV